MKYVYETCVTLLLLAVCAAALYNVVARMAEGADAPAASARSSGADG